MILDSGVFPEARGWAHGKWVRVLTPLVERPGLWVKVATKDSPDGARATASQLRRRIYRIPRPDEHWEFSSEGYSVYARYLGAPR